MLRSILGVILVLLVYVCFAFTYQSNFNSSGHDVNTEASEVQPNLAGLARFINSKQ